MQTRPLGRAGIQVSELCLGTMTFGGQGGYWAQIGALSPAESEALVRQSLDAGINFIDTADVYAGGESEEVTGEALRNIGVARDQLVVATKGFSIMGPGPNQRGASRVHLLDACKASLRRLGLDYIDLYQIHGFDPATPMEESLRALDTLVQHGHVRYVGLSNWAAWQIAKALGIAERLGLHRPVSLQAYYSLVGRDLEREIVPLLRSEGTGLMVWSPLAGGFLSGKYREGGTEGRRDASAFPPVDPARGDAVLGASARVAEAHGVSMAQVALAWLLHQPAVTSVIVGARRPDQLADNIAAASVRLALDEIAALDAASALPAEYPGWMLDFQGKNRRDLLKAAR